MHQLLAHDERKCLSCFLPNVVGVVADFFVQFVHFVVSSLDCYVHEATLPPISELDAELLMIMCFMMIVAFCVYFGRRRIHNTCICAFSGQQAQGSMLIDRPTAGGQSVFLSIRISEERGEGAKAK